MQQKTSTSSHFTLILSVNGIDYLTLLPMSRLSRNLGKASQVCLPSSCHPTRLTAPVHTLNCGSENRALFYKLQELQTVASPQIPVVRQPEKSGSLERTSAVLQSNKLQESQTVASPQIPVVRQPEKSGSLERTSAASQSYQLQDTETVASPQVHVVRQPEKSGPLERTSSVSQSFSHLTIEREPVGTAQFHSDLDKLSAEAAAEHSSSFSEDCEVSDIVPSFIGHHSFFSTI